MTQATAGWVLLVLGTAALISGFHCKELDTRFLNNPTTTQSPGDTWSRWSAWSPCSVTCDLGTRYRLRHCVGGNTCKGQLVERDNCNVQRCIHVVDGQWGTWNAWQACSATCGDGVKARERRCDSPAPQDGGNPCSGQNREIAYCKTSECPIDGGWSNYTVRPCSKTCGLGVAVSIRTCTEPAPQYGGATCSGAETKFSACNERVCIVDGMWSEWSSFTTCKVICGDGQKRRDRTCTSPPPQNGGKDCVGHTEEMATCNNGACPKDIKTCDEQQIGDLMMNGTTSPLSCVNGSDVIAEIDMVATFCNAPNDDLKWTLGIAIADNCEAFPLRSPIGLVHRDTKEKKYGILLNCHQEILEYASETCNAGFVIQTVNLTHSTDFDFHLLLWKQEEGGSTAILG